MNSLLKNLSIKEHIDKINKKKDFTLKKDLILSNLTIKDIYFKNKFGFKKITEKEFNKLKFFFNNLNNNKISFLTINPIFFKSFIEKSNINNIQKLYLIKDYTFKNMFFNEEFNFKDFIIKNNNINNNEFLFNSLFLNEFYLTKKVFNSFSLFIFLKDTNIYLLKRKNKYFIFINEVK